MKNTNLRRHCYAVSCSMGGIYSHLEKEGILRGDAPARETWEVLGIIHDADYELTKDDPQKHTLLTLQWLEEASISINDPLYLAVQSHNNRQTNLRNIQTQMEWALECCDELTGFIVACALVQPDKKLASVGVESVLKKWKQPAFARSIDRKQIEQCEMRLGIPLEEFIGIVLKSMQENSDELGL